MNRLDPVDIGFDPVDVVDFDPEDIGFEEDIDGA